jgi:uncharacterized membrane protein required for colicin V production
MTLNLLVVAIIVLSGLLWASPQKGRGLFSALIHLACVLVAGGLAFALWEPVVYGFLLNSAPDYAWCLGLLVPFVVVLLVLRIATDMTIGKNMDLGDGINFAGGAVFGGLAGLVTAGMLMIGVAHLRVGKEFLGYSPLSFSGGSLVGDKKMWVPADRLVTALYEGLSIGGFGTDTGLAERQPRVWEAAAMMRTTLQGGGEKQSALGRTTVAKNDVTLKGRYTVGPGAADLMLTDSFVLGDDGKPSKSKFVYADGDVPSGEVSVEGFVLEFASGAVEKSGQSVIGPGQVRLICRTSDGKGIGIHPAAIVARPEAGAGMYRFRMDAPDIFIPSVGGGSNAVFAPEFIVPKGAVPTDLIVKGTRYELSGLDASKAVAYANTNGRDEAIRNGSLFQKFGISVPGGGSGTKPAAGGAKPGAGTPSGGTPSAGTPTPAPSGGNSTKAGQVINTSGGRIQEMQEQAQLPDNMILNAGEIGGLEVNGDRKIVDGEHQFDKAIVANNRGIDRNLRVDQFAATKDTTVVQVLLANAGAMSVLGRSVEAAEDILPPVIIDTNGQQYEAIGYVYAEGNIIRVRYTPGRPLRGLSELPSRVSRSKRDQSVRLLFRPTKGVSIASFNLGPKQMATFEPALALGK